MSFLIFTTDRANWSLIVTSLINWGISNDLFITPRLLSYARRIVSQDHSSNESSSSQHTSFSRGRATKTKFFASASLSLFLQLSRLVGCILGICEVLFLMTQLDSLVNWTALLYLCLGACLSLYTGLNVAFTQLLCAQWKGVWRNGPQYLPLPVTAGAGVEGQAQGVKLDEKALVKAEEKEHGQESARLVSLESQMKAEESAGETVLVEHSADMPPPYVAHVEHVNESAADAKTTDEEDGFVAYYDDGVTEV